MVILNTYSLMNERFKEKNKKRLNDCFNSNLIGKI